MTLEEEEEEERERERERRGEERRDCVAFSNKKVENEIKKEGERERKWGRE